MALLPTFYLDPQVHGVLSSAAQRWHHIQGHPALFLSNSDFVYSLQVLSEKKIGIVAHFYMDPQVQGVLSSAAQRWPHIHISDSLVMADRAVNMVEQGCTTVAVLGVDFMSENVRAILDEAGHQDTKVSLQASLM